MKHVCSNAAEVGSDTVLRPSGAADDDPSVCVQTEHTAEMTTRPLKLFHPEEKHLGSHTNERL